MVSRLPKKTVRLAISSLCCATLLWANGVDSARVPPPSNQAARSTKVKNYQQEITPERLAAELHYFASDFFEGREATTRGQKMAAHYLASRYRQIGLTAKGTTSGRDANDLRSYFQPFRVYRRTPETTRLELFVKGRKVATSDFSATAHDDLSYFMSGNAANASGGIVFAGYGIADDKLGYDDYQELKHNEISIAGKWVLILDDEPMADAQTSLLPTPERKLSKWSQFFAKRRALLKATSSAKGLLVVTESSPRFKGSFAQAAATASQNARRLGPISLDQFAGTPQAYAISTNFANRILRPSGHTIANLRKQIDRQLKPLVFEVKGSSVTSTVEQSMPLVTENVLAFIEGSDPRFKDEVVIVSSHYDHLGLNPTLVGDQIFNGAADDGSGAVASLELARAFMTAKREGFGPRRSLLFVNFSAEEKGLLGSAYYAHREPIIPLAQTVADINMDGVAGIDPKHPAKSKNYIYVVGAGELSQEFIEISARAKESTGSTIELTSAPYFNSDQYNFQTQFIPFIYYSTGLTEHYHQPSDEPATIDFDHFARVVRLIFASTWKIANQDARPKAVDRSKLALDGYVCPPCPFECDDAVHARGGECAVCGMGLIPKYSISKTVD